MLGGKGGVAIILISGTLSLGMSINTFVRAGMTLSVLPDPIWARVWTRELMRVPSTAHKARTPILSRLTQGCPTLLLTHTTALKTQFKLLPKSFNSLITQCVWERKADKASLVSFMAGPDTPLLAIVPEGLHCLDHGDPEAPAQPKAFREQL